MARSLDTLLEIVAVIAPLARPADPPRCSMRQFNAARAGSPFPDAPTANAIHLAVAKHTTGGVSWQQIVALAFADPADRTGVLRAATRADQQPWLTRRHVFFALNRVACFLDVPTLIPREYAAGRAALIRHARHRDADRELAELLPTEGQIERIARDERQQAADERAGVSDWDYALDMAGLTARAERVTARRVDAVAGRARRGDLRRDEPGAAVRGHAGRVRRRRGDQAAGQAAGRLTRSARRRRSAAARRRPSGPGAAPAGGPRGPAGSDRPGRLAGLRRGRRAADARPSGRGAARVGSRAAGPRTHAAPVPGLAGRQRAPGLAALQRVAAFSELRTDALRLNANGAPPLCPLLDGKTAAVTPELLRTIAAGATRTIGRAPARTGRPVFRGPRPWLSQVIAVGLLSLDEQLVAEHAGERYGATLNADGDITVNGHAEPVATLNQAVALVSTAKIGGWQFWTVIRDGKPVPLAELRAQLADAPDAHPA